jgi:hypothetical protein
LNYEQIVQKHIITQPIVQKEKIIQNHQIQDSY